MENLAIAFKLSLTLFLTSLFFSTQAQSGAALDFDGTDDYALLNSNATFDVNQFTIETWVKWDRNNAAAVDFICGRGLEQMEIHLGNGLDNTRIRFIPVAGVYLDAPTNTLPSGTTSIMHPFAMWAVIKEAVRPSESSVRDDAQDGADGGRSAAPSGPAASGGIVRDQAGPA